VNNENVQICTLCRYILFSEMPTKRAFVIMPFSPTASEKNWTEVFEGVFQPSLKDCGYSCTRAETSRGSLIASIVEGLVEADLVIADVTDRNPNVFYELGVRHSLRRGTIIVSQGTDHVPSDLRGYWFLPYGLRPAEVTKFKADIKRIVAEFEEQPERSDSPVSDYLDREQISSSRQVNRDNIKKIGALLTELSGNRLALRQQLETGKPQVFSLGCIELLIQTLYVDVGTDILKVCYEFQYKLQLLQKEISSNQIIASSIRESDILYNKISDIRTRITRGEFSEPSMISMMTWSPRESASNASNSGAACETLLNAPGTDPVEDGDLEEDYSYSYSGVGAECLSCGGSGSVVCSACAGSARGCTACNGVGQQLCPTCGGAGSPGGR
jgi:hypothetical protein